MMLNKNYNQKHKENLRGIVFDIQRYSLGDGGGIRTTVFMKGCNLRCRWCQNPESLKMEPEIAYRSDRCIQCGACIKVCSSKAIQIGGTFVTHFERCISCAQCADVCPRKARYLIGRLYTVTELLFEVQRDAVFFEASGGGVTLSGGEATLQLEFVEAFLKACKNAGIHTAIETNGLFNRKAFAEVLPYIDQIFFDIKIISSEKHKQYTGVDNRIILENASWLARCSNKVSFRTPLVPGMTLTESNMKDLEEFLKKATVKNIEFCLYQAGWEKKLQWLDTKQEPMNLAPLLPIDIVDTIEFFKASGIEPRIL